MLDREPPDDVYEALKRAVDALGGAKRVGPRMRPELDPFGARAWLLNCLNPEHAQKFDPPQVFLILRWAAEIGFHESKHFIDHITDYAPSVPLAPTVLLVEAMKVAAQKQREADESARNLRELIDNPRLLATMRAAGIKVDA